MCQIRCLQARERRAFSNADDGRKMRFDRTARIANLRLADSVVELSFRRRSLSATFAGTPRLIVQQVVILAFPGVNLLDVAGPAQVFTSAAELCSAEGCE